MPRERPSKVHPLVDRLAAYSWRILVIGAVAAVALWLIGILWVVVLPLVFAAFLTRALIRPTDWLRSRRFPPALAAATALVGFIVALAAAFGLIGYAVGQQSTSIGPAVTHAIDDIQNWIVTDAPGDVSRSDIQDARESLTNAAGDWFRSSGGALVSGAVVAFQIVMGLFIGLIVTFFALKDGRRFFTWTVSQFPAARHDHIRSLTAKAWATLGGYLRGAALLGLLEGAIIAVTLALVGAQLAVPVGAITFLLAFIPFAGAIIAGAVAVLVALSTAGPTAALIVLIVAVVVQQLDGDLLAPVIYGKQLELHPVLVLLTITAGGSLFGVAGAFLAVPTAAIVVNVLGEHRRLTRASDPATTEPTPRPVAPDTEVIEPRPPLS